MPTLHLRTDIDRMQYLKKKDKARSVVRPFEGSETAEAEAELKSEQRAGGEPEAEAEPEQEAETEPEPEPEPEPDEGDAEAAEEDGSEDKEGQVKPEYKDAVHTARPPAEIDYILPLITKSSNLRTNSMRASWDETFLLDEVSSGCSV